MDASHQVRLENSEGASRLLAGWGLRENLLRDPVRWAYENHVAEVTADEPINSRGTTMYLRLTGELRRSLKPLGWTIDRSGNLEMTVHPEGHLAIVVANGDRDTGQSNRQPCTVSRKGPRTKKALQDQLFDFEEIPRVIRNSRYRAVLVLLVHVDDIDHEVRCELSRPRTVADNGYIEEWTVRALLTAIPMTPAPFGGGVSIVEESDAIDINISRRSTGA